VHAAIRAKRLAITWALIALAPAAFATVLPEDRADLLYHRYDGGGVTIDGPSVLVRKSIGDKISLSANYYIDMVSSASIDVETTASPYEEERTQYSVGADILNGKSTYSLGYINSSESDYEADTYYAGVSQSMFGDLTTVSFGFKLGENVVKRNVAGVSDPDFLEEMQTRSFSVGVSQIMTRNLILTFNFETITDEGFLRSPYRSVRFLTTPTTQALQSEVYPNTRTSNAGSIRGKYFLPYRAAIDAGYRYYNDTWGVVGHTGEVGYTHPLGPWTFEAKGRYYKQVKADFYRDLFPRRDFANFIARDKELSTFNSINIGVGATYEFKIPQAPWVQRSAITAKYDYLTVNYDDFRDATKSIGSFGLVPDNPVAPGAEPLYKLNANVIQIFFSIWF
jgi:Protein of unknown function (DUF3570)